MNDESLITDAIRALVGRTSAPRTARIEPLALQRLMQALGDQRPIKLEPGLEAPIYAISLLQPDAETLALPADLEGSLVAGDEWELLRPLRIGEPLIAESRILDVSERFSGRYGQMLYLRYEWTFADTSGSIVASARRIIGRYRSTRPEPADA